MVVDERQRVALAQAVQASRPYPNRLAVVRDEQVPPSVATEIHGEGQPRVFFQEDAPSLMPRVDSESMTQAPPGTASVSIDVASCVAG